LSLAAGIELMSVTRFSFIRTSHIDVESIRAAAASGASAVSGASRALKPILVKFQWFWHELGQSSSEIYCNRHEPILTNMGMKIQNLLEN
jgi:hypothetical protein